MSRIQAEKPSWFRWTWYLESVFWMNNLASNLPSTFVTGLMCVTTDCSALDASMIRNSSSLPLFLILFGKAVAHLFSAAVEFRPHDVGCHWLLRCCCRDFRHPYFHICIVKYTKNQGTLFITSDTNECFRMERDCRAMTSGISNDALYQWMANILS